MTSRGSDRQTGSKYTFTRNYINKTYTYHLTSHSPAVSVNKKYVKPFP